MLRKVIYVYEILYLLTFVLLRWQIVAFSYSKMILLILAFISLALIGMYGINREVKKEEKPVVWMFMFLTAMIIGSLNE